MVTRCDLIRQKDLPPGKSPINLFERFGYDAAMDMDALLESL
jgi:hypothetical protein